MQMEVIFQTLIRLGLKNDIYFLMAINVACITCIKRKYIKDEIINHILPKFFYTTLKGITNYNIQKVNIQDWNMLTQQSFLINQ